MSTYRSFCIWICGEPVSRNHNAQGSRVMGHCESLWSFARLSIEMCALCLLENGGGGRGPLPAPRLYTDYAPVSRRSRTRRSG